MRVNEMWISMSERLRTCPVHMLPICAAGTARETRCEMLASISS